jgi:hypothetical protein
MSLDLEAIRKRCEQATPGPWYRDASRKGSQHQPISPAADNAHASVEMDNGKRVASLHITAWKQGPRDARPDADFIAHARDDIPALLDWVDRARVLLRALNVDSNYLEIENFLAEL